MTMYFLLTPIPHLAVPGPSRISSQRVRHHSMDSTQPERPSRPSGVSWINKCKGKATAKASTCNIKIPHADPHGEAGHASSIVSRNIEAIFGRQWVMAAQKAGRDFGHGRVSVWQNPWRQCGEFRNLDYSRHRHSHSLSHTRPHTRRPSSSVYLTDLLFLHRPSSHRKYER